MDHKLTLPKYSIGTGDRFAHQAKAQLDACIRALDHGVEVAPVWNKSNREHTIIGSEPAETRRAADEAVKAKGWRLPYFVDADHIGEQTMDRFFFLRIGDLQALEFSDRKDRLSIGVYDVEAAQ